FGYKPAPDCLVSRHPPAGQLQVNVSQLLNQEWFFMNVVDRLISVKTIRLTSRFLVLPVKALPNTIYYSPTREAADEYLCTVLAFTQAFIAYGNVEDESTTSIGESTKSNSPSESNGSSESDWVEPRLNALIHAHQLANRHHQNKPCCDEVYVKESGS
ncbi:hypothetical protein Leryth_002131, partial [Lithospermum erythrorhizon]